MATITSTGLGSGLDIENLVSQLVAVEGRPASQRLDRREAELQARLSAYGTLKGAVSSLQSSLSSLKDVASLQNRSATSSDKAVATASSTNAAAIGSYDLSVTQLAESQRLVSDPAAGATYTSLTDVVGTGSLTFSFGTVDYDTGTDDFNSAFVPNADKSSKTVTITDGSLTGIRDAVNNADIGVKASILYDGTNYRLGFSPEDTGAQNALEVSVTDDDGDNTDAAGLSLLSFTETANHMLQNQAAQDAQLNINGVDITSESNTLDKTVDGVTMNLLATGSSTIEVADDVGAITDNIRGFVDNFNELVNTINKLGDYNAETQRAGVLNGDATLRGLESRLNRLINTPVEGADSDYQILAQIGITRNSTDGTLELDAAKLNAAVEDDAQAVTALFSEFGEPSDSLIDYKGSTDATQTGEYSINVTQLATQGQLTGSQAANLTISAGSNDALAVEVDGISTTVTLDAGTYTASSLAAHVQSKLNATDEFQSNEVAVTVTQSGGVLSMTSDRYGSASKVAVTGGNGSTDLFGASPTSTDGVDVEGTIGGVTAVGSGRTLTGSGDASGLSVEITGGTTGSRGTVNFTRGYADQLDALLDSLLDDEGLFDPLTKSIQDRIENVNDDRRALSRRLDNLEERLRADFNAMDQLVNQFQSTGNFLSQQLASIPVIGANRDK